MYIINSPEEMIQLGYELSTKYNKIILYGDLGAGKTLLTKGFAKGFGIDFDIVKSPTYTYLNIYDNKFLHIDMYRINNFVDLIDKGLIDAINEYDFYSIEWPKFIEQKYLDKYTSINIQKTGDKARKITIL